MSTTDTAITLRLSERAKAKLTEQAANSGRDLSEIASDLIENVITLPSVAEIMGPVRQQVKESGMSDDELNGFLREEIDAHRREKKAKSA
jgi:hypothetical protein